MFHDVRFVHLRDNGDEEAGIKVPLRDQSPDESYELSIWPPLFSEDI
jgi:hypothetical protein